MAEIDFEKVVLMIKKKPMRHRIEIAKGRRLIMILNPIASEMYACRDGR